MEKIISALQAKKTSRYSINELDTMIKDACAENRTSIKINVMLVNNDQVKILKEAGYSLDHTKGMLEISWHYAG